MLVALVICCAGLTWHRSIFVTYDGTRHISDLAISTARLMRSGENSSVDQRTAHGFDFAVRHMSASFGFCPYLAKCKSNSNTSDKQAMLFSA